MILELSRGQKTEEKRPESGENGSVVDEIGR